MPHDDRVPTLQDVADRAGVSRPTASRALSGKGRMAHETRERVQRAADELGYVVNATARNLRFARSGAVGLRIPDLALGARYYMDVAFGAAQAAASAGLLVTLLPPSDEATPMAEQLDGYIVIDPMDGDVGAERLLARGRPVVSGEFTPPGMPQPAGTVYSDHSAGMRTILDHLRDCGAGQPACVLPVETSAWARQMREGYEAWCADAGIAPRIALTSFATTIDEVRAAVDELLAQHRDIDAIVAGAEGGALGILQSVRAAGLVPGRDVLVASHVDSETLTFTDPPVTALDLSPREFGAACLTLLADVLDGSAEPGTERELPLRLVARASTLGV